MELPVAIPDTMPRTLYSPRLSDDVVRSLYRAAKRRRMPMTRLADELILAGLAKEDSSAHGVAAATQAASLFTGKRVA